MKKMNHRGDTIIEVLLAMSVIGMVLGTSYAIANRSLAVGRLAQEQTEALKIAETQLEKLKSMNTNQKILLDSDIEEEFCIAKDSLQKTNTGNEGCKDGLYTSNIKYHPQTGTNEAYFEVIVSWERDGISEDGSIKLYYKLEKSK